jgi:hypothetical protein
VLLLGGIKTIHTEKGNDRREKKKMRETWEMNGCLVSKRSLRRGRGVGERNRIRLRDEVVLFFCPDERELDRVASELSW